MSLGLHGYVDGLKNRELLGWCWEKGRPETFDCELLIGESPYQTTTANLFRLDLLDAGMNDGRHGFKFDLRTFDLEVFDQKELRQMSVRVVGTDVKLQASSFIPFFISKEAELHGGAYLAKFLNEREKIDCYNTCNKFLFKKMDENFEIPKLLWMRSAGNHSISMVLKHADFAPLEGELSLSTLFDGSIIYSLTFSVIRGIVVGRDETLVLFVGGLQGRPNCREKIAKFTKMNDGVHPRMLLFTAILALCEVWKLPVIVAISADQQISCNTQERLASFIKIYDRFWRDMGGAARDADGQVFFIHTDRMSSSKQRPQHWHRYLQRRVIRDKIQQEILGNL